MRTTRIAVALTALIATAAIAGPAQAQTTSSGGTIDVDNCTIKTSRNAGGFTWAYCPVVVQAPLGQTVTVRYSENLALFNPHTNGTWHPRSGTLAFAGGGTQTLSVAFAFRGRRTTSSVARSFKLTLSHPSGATLTDSTATANATPTSA